MVRSLRAIVLLSLLLGLPAATVWASPLFLSDWGISYGNWTPAALAPPNVSYAVEDWVSGNNGYLGPGYGGDEYDVEAVYLAFDAENYYFAVVTGFPLAGRDAWGGHYVEHYDPGDLALDLNGDNVYDAAVDVSDGGLLRTGNLAWQNPAIEGHQAWGGVSDPLRVTSWSQSQSIEGFRYGTFSGRYAIEAVIDRDDLDVSGPLKLHWTMGCGNDLGEGVIQPVPEPASLMLLGAGLALVGVARRIKKNA